MVVNIVTKTVTLNKSDMTGETWRGDVYGLKFRDVHWETKQEIEKLVGFRVIYAHRKKRVLMLYNK
ncbi:MAG: hypothetical protein KA007_00525 [Candidatus Pacebacteria bacterium]|jgi:hypothetical protein|nr:hypothetical protein [Candidatus Paceibacterota bacterium]OQA64750.1 MAG: hypothetical protein BWY38_02944 [Ignavibacteria bacterium ADurb.Bin266]